MLPGSEVAHRIRSVACWGCFVYAPTARSMPPSGGRLGVPDVRAGVRGSRPRTPARARYPTRQLARGRAVVLPLNIVVKPNELPCPLGRTVAMKPVLSQVNE